MARNLEDSVVVITGASSGIGRATAHAFAKKGSHLVLAARRSDALDDVVRECEGQGVRALAVPVDVSDEQAVEELAQLALREFGRIDVWVNNAAVTLFGRFEEIPSAVYRRVLEVNIFGYVHGARAAMKAFREQGSGVLVNTASVVSEVPQPYTSAYVMSKHAIRALGQSLRQELTLDKGHDIHVCTVMPATIDTPLFEHAANYTGRAVRAMPPVLAPEDVATTIVNLARRPRREVIVGNAGRMMVQQERVAPSLTEAMMARTVDRQHLYPDRTEGPTRGNLFEPMRDTATVRGGWGAPPPRPKRLARRGIAAVAGLAVLGVAAASVLSLMRDGDGRGRPAEGTAEAKERLEQRHLRRAA